MRADARTALPASAATCVSAKACAGAISSRRSRPSGTTRRRSRRWRSPARSRPASSGSAPLLQRVPIGEVGAPGAALGVTHLVVGELIGIELGPPRRLVVVDAGVVPAEDRVLHRAVGRTERRERVLLLHVGGGPPA